MKLQFPSLKLSKRKLGYAMAGFMVIGVNGNATAPTIQEWTNYAVSHLPQQRSQYGVWDINSKNMPVRAVHAALLHTGKVLIVAGSGNNKTDFTAKSFKTVLWDPTNNTFKDIDTPWDAFCSGHAFLPDGKVLVAGGTYKYEDLQAKPRQDYAGLKDSYVFDPDTEKYVHADALTTARWYPTLVGLGNGDVLATSGLNEQGKLVNTPAEIFNAATNTWAPNPKLNKQYPTYPTLMLTGDGRLFFSGSNSGYGPHNDIRSPGLWNVATGEFNQVGAPADADLLETSSSVLLPPAQDQKVMLMGGGGYGDSRQSTSRTAIIDLSKPNPAYVTGPPLKSPTRYPGIVILPDDTLLETGGSSDYRNKDLKEAQIYHPDTNTFSKAASPSVGRDYHSEAILMPDGRVATFGSNPIDNSFELRIEIYSPSYLFKGTRPTIAQAATETERGSSFSLATGDGGPLKNAKLIRPSAVTHVTNVEQRSINLPIHKTASGYTADVPANLNLVPSGWYMLFVENNDNVPSSGTWIHVK